MLSSVIGFDLEPRTRLVFAPGAVERLGELARELGGGTALVVTDPGIVAAGHIEAARRCLTAAGVASVVFEEVRENPTTLDVDRCLAVAQRGGVSLIIGFGGGSSLDTAKGCNFLLTNGGRMQDYWGVGKATKPMLPLIAVPTTAGTGSECQSYALIADEDTHQKMACGDPKAAPQVALLDPVLTLSQPRQVTACTGMDAVSHALESAVSRRRNELSLLFSREAFRLTFPNLKHVLEEPENLRARAAMQLGAAYAGMAIENSMLGAAHSAANPLTAHYGVVHGLAVGTMLPHVIRFNAHEPPAAETYRELAISIGLVKPDAGCVAAAEALAEGVAELVEITRAACGVPPAVVPDEMLSRLAGEANGQWTARFNPREIDAGDFDVLYRAALA
jgi:alcohol dehydrogenase